MSQIPALYSTKFFVKKKKNWISSNMQLDQILKPISYNVPDFIFHNFLFQRCIITMANITLTLIYNINTDDLSRAIFA